MKKSVLIICLLSMTFFVYSQMYTVSSFEWYDKETIPVFFEIPSGTAETTVTIDTYGNNPATLQFFITLNDGTTDIVGNGSYILTTGDAVSGKTIQCSGTGPYVVTITDNTGGTATNEYWGITIAGLGGGTNHTGAAITGGGLFPYGNVWHWNDDLLDAADNDEEINILFDVNGSVYTNIHKALVYIESSEPIYRVELNGVTSGCGLLSPQNIDPALGSSPSWISGSVGSSSTGGTTYNFSEISAGSIYLLEIEVLNKTSPPPPDSDFDFNEKWQLILSYTAGVTEVQAAVSIKIEDNSAVDITPAVGESTDPASLTRQPLAAITKPVNQPSTLTLPVMRERTFTFEADSPVSPTMTWYKDGVQQPSLSSDSISNISQVIYTLKSKETVTTSGYPYSNFTHFAFDSLTVQSYGKEYIGFPYARGVPYDEGREPHIDGIVEGPDGQQETSGSDAGEIYGENGWSGAYRITHADGTITEDVAFQALRSQDGNRLYMSFEVKNDSSLDATDVIVVGIRPDASSTTEANDRLLRIYPLSGTIQYYQDSSNWQQYTPTLTTQFNVGTNDQTATNQAWSVEVQIPVPAQGTEWPQIQNDFLLYYDVFRTYTEVSTDLLVSQFAWPRFSQKVRGNIDTFQFSPSYWGLARKANPLTTNGVSIGWSDIGVITAPGDLVSTPTNIMSTNTSNTNTFVARVHNNTIQEIDDGGGGVIDNQREVSNVNVTFRIANWGVPPYDSATYWEIIPANVSPYDNNPVMTQTSPTMGATIIGPSSTGQYEAQWQLTSAQRDRYILDHSATVNELHQCINVVLDAPSGNVNFINKSVVRNMNFDGASTFEQEARIDGRGYGKPPFGWEKHRFLLYINKYKLEGLPGQVMQQPTDLTTGLQPRPVDKNTYLNWSAHAMRYTGEIVIIDGAAHTIVDPVGSFGHVMIHEGEVLHWDYSLEGLPKLRKNPDIFLVDVPEDEVKKVNTVIKAVEPTGHVSLHGGASIPLTQFAADYEVGWNVIADLGFKIIPRLYIMGMFGYNWFPAKSSGVDDTSILNISLTAKYYLPVQPFLDIGIGVGPELYITDFDFNRLDVGYNVDLSLDYRITNAILAEIGAIYHSHFSEEYWFIQTHAGLLFRF